jgi:hypothetical protein
MEAPIKSLAIAATFTAVLVVATLADAETSATLRLDKLELHNLKAEPVSYEGRVAIRVIDNAPANVADAGRLAVVPGTSLQDGTIEVDLTGDTLPMPSQLPVDFSVSHFG